MTHSGPLLSLVLVPAHDLSCEAPTDVSLAFLRDGCVHLVVDDGRAVRVLPSPAWHRWWGCSVDAVDEGFLAEVFLEKLGATRLGVRMRSRTPVTRLGPAELEGVPSRLVVASSPP